MSKQRIMLDDNAFRRIVRGEVVEVLDNDNNKVDIAMSDIGWGQMQKHIDDAVMGKGGDGE